MGMWDFAPWDNDTAADWFGDLFDTTHLRDAWLEGIQADPEDDPETVRAAAWLFLQLGRVYVWPIGTFDDDLALAVNALTRVRDSEEFAEVPELVAAVSVELTELQSRMK